MVIQRLQSVWLLLASIAMGYFAFVPFAYLGETPITSLNTLPYFIYNIAIALLLFINIFMYTNVDFQRKVTKILVWLIAGSGLCAGLLTYLPEQEGITLGWGWILLAAAFILGIMAYRGIRSDIRKLRDSDRLR